MNTAGRQPADTSELKVPARAQYVMVAKRAAGALGSCAGFSLADVDDLNIAVAQACEKAIGAAERLWGPGNGYLKLTFRLVDGGMQVDVRTLPPSEEQLRAQAEARRAEQSRRAQAEREALVRRARRSAAMSAMTERDLEEAAVNMIRLFVDELRYNVDRQGSMRMRMVKYLVE